MRKAREKETYIGVLERPLVRSQPAVGRREEFLESDGNVVERDGKGREVERRGGFGGVSPEEDVFGRFLAGEIVVGAEGAVACAGLAGDQL